MSFSVQHNQLELFQGLSPHELNIVYRHMRLSEYQSGETIFRAGEEAHHLHLIHQGLVKVLFITPDGSEKILRIAESGSIFGELFLGEYPFRVGYAVSMSDSMIYRISAQNLQHLIRCFPMISFNFIRHLVDSHRTTLAQLQSLLRMDSEGRLLGILLSLSRQLCSSDDDTFQLPSSITQEDLANLSGLNRSTVSSLINQFRRTGMMGGSGRILTINRAAIEQYLRKRGFELLR